MSNYVRPVPLLRNIEPSTHTEAWEAFRVQQYEHERYEHPLWDIIALDAAVVTVLASGSSNITYRPPANASEEEFLIYGLALVWGIGNQPPVAANDLITAILVHSTSTIQFPIAQAVWAADWNAIPFTGAQAVWVWPWQLKGVGVPYTPQWIPPVEPLRIFRKNAGDPFIDLVLGYNADATVGTRKFTRYALLARRPKLHDI
jgi:hypothetical protein